VNGVRVHSSLESFVLNLSTFECERETTLMKSGSGSEVSVKRYFRRSDVFEIIVKSFDCFDCENLNEILCELFQLEELGFGTTQTVMHCSSVGNCFSNGINTTENSNATLLLWLT
jgi:hypothetical protein